MLFHVKTGINEQIFLEISTFDTYFIGGKVELVIKNNKSKTKAITYPDVRKNDNAITYPDVKKKDNAITYPDVKKKDNAITYPDVRKNDNAITYPEFLCPMGVLPEILDEDEAYDYLFDVLSGIKKYNMKKHVLEVEDWLNSESDEEPTEWYFSYGTDIDGEFFPTKYFAVNEDGDIFEYNFEEETWYLLAIPYLK